MNMEIANQLVSLRKKNGLSQEALAEKLGISRQAVSKWERGEASPDTDNLIQLAKLYQISLDEMLLLKTPAAADEEEASQTKTDDPAPDETPPPQRGAGIHLKSKDGEIYIGRDGIYATDFTDTVHSQDTARLTINGQSYTWREARAKWRHNYPARFPLTLLALLIYLGIGMFYDIWHPTWLIFLLIPLTGKTLAAIQHKNWRKLPYPLIITVIYLCLGFLYHSWHPAWVLFLTIPLYYSGVSYFTAKRSPQEPL
jgi:transcriptional regulator with XRE-family HTH domain